MKFTREGGRVRLRAACVPRVEVGRLSGAWTGRSLSVVDDEFEEFLELRVFDSGIGIAPEGLERLFKPFSQIDSALSREFEGTGLGLMMVKLLAELHGGTVAVESAVGEGSCFTVWLPLRTPLVSVQTSVKVRWPPSSGRGGSALMVEDSVKPPS